MSKLWRRDLEFYKGMIVGCAPATHTSAVELIARQGEHWGFGERNYRLQRHISPMTYDAMRKTMSENGFRLVDSVTAGSFAGPLQKIVLAPWAAMFRLIGGPRALGETSIYLAQK